MTALRLEKKWLALVVGIVLGILWLYPSYKFPWAPREPDPAGRMARVFAPLLLWILWTPRFPRHLAGPLGALLVSVFFLWPVLSFQFLPTNNYLVFGVLPIILAGTVLIPITSFSFSIWRFLVIGVGLVANVFIIWSLLQHGFHFSTYFLRPRLHLGFNHPLVTGAAVIASFAAVWFIISEYIHRRFSPGLRRLVIGVLVAYFGFLLLGSGSRSLNIVMIGCWLPVFFSLFPKTGKQLPKVLWFIGMIGVVLILGSGPLLPEESKFFASVDKFSSNRLTSFNQDMQSYWDFSGGMEWLGPSHILSEFYRGIGRGFAFVDCVYFSYLLLYGMTAFVALFVLIAGTGWTLTRQGWKDVRFGLWFGLIFFFAFDAQGITPSNLIVFLLFGALFAGFSIVPPALRGQ